MKKQSMAVKLLQALANLLLAIASVIQAISVISTLLSNKNENEA